MRLESPYKRSIPDQVVGYVPGGWDMFHVGHLNILRQARAHCDILMVGVVSDEALFDMKGRHPVISLEERLEIVGAIGIVDKVIVDFSRDKTLVWNAHHFDILFKGDDWKNTPKGMQLEFNMASVGVRVHYFPYTQSTSSTMLREALSIR